MSIVKKMADGLVNIVANLGTARDKACLLYTSPSPRD